MFTGDREGEEADIPDIYPTNNQIYNFTTLVSTMLVISDVNSEHVAHESSKKAFLVSKKPI